MLDTSTDFKNAIENNHALTPKVKLTAEWNLNRYGSSVASSASVRSLDDDLFPIESISLPNRPKSGQPFWIGRGRPTSHREERRWRVPGEDSVYKYWASKVFGGTKVSASIYTFFGELLPANKLFVTFETGHADSQVGRPTNVDVFTTQDGMSYDLAYNGSLQSPYDGTIELWWNGSQWAEKEETEFETQIYGVVVRVNRVAYSNRSIQVIELGAGLKKDLSDRVSSINVSKVREEMDQLLPVGTMEANSVNISIDNTDRLFDPTNTESPYYKLIDNNVCMRPYFGYEINGQDEFVPGGEFYVDNWIESSDSATVDIKATDASKFLQEQNTPTCFFVNHRAAVIISEILAKVGMHGINWNMSNFDNEYSIPYVWFEDDETIWEALSSVAKSEQAVFYFDENGILNYDSKNYIFDPNRPVDWELRKGSDGSSLSNIEKLSNDYEVMANKVKISYEPLAANYNRDRIPVYSALWEPTESIALQAGALQDYVTSSSNTVRVDPEVASLMPYIGYVELDGEIIKYTGKSYKHYPTAKYKVTVVESQEEKDDLDDDSNPYHSHKNEFIGVLNNIERGQFNSAVKNHTPDAIRSAWIKRRFHESGSLQTAYSLSDVQDARARLWNAGGSSYNSWNLMYRGNHGTRMNHYGTRIRFDGNNAQVHGIAGLATHLYSAGGIFRGYYFELVLSDFVNNVALGGIGSVRAYRMDTNGQRRGLPDTEEGLRGYDLPIVADRDYELEVSYFPDVLEWAMYLDGKQITTFRDNYGGSYRSGRFGVYVRGRTRALFDYVYATNSDYALKSVTVNNSGYYGSTV